MPNSYSVCVAVFIGAGSRYEVDEKAGISHFIEHLAFKGTQKRATAQDISEAIEGIGGVLNGGTDKEVTVYWAKVARPHLAIALDVLSDMLLHSRLEPQEVEKERGVILEEIRMTWDSPAQRVDLLIDDTVWPQQPLGRDVAGSPGSVAELSRQDMVDFMAHHYFPTNTVIAVAGDVSHQEVVAGLSRGFGSWPGGQPQPWYPADNGQGAPRLRVETRDTEQAHLCLALRGLSSLDPDRFTLNLLNTILGEGMSSRLFLEIREKRGLAYDIHSYLQQFLDAGSWIICAGVDPRKLESAIGAILDEVSKLREGIPESGLARAREFLKGRLLLRMEDTRSVAGWLGGQELLIGQVLTVDEVVSRLEAITTQDLERLARSLILPQKLNLAVVGPLAHSDRLENLLHL